MKMNSERAEQPQVSGQPPAPGAQLAAARQALGLSVAQIADQLKLAPRQVIALEAGDLAALPNLAVVRGFVRAYAKAVKLDAAPLVAMVASPLELSAADAPRRQVPTSFSEARFPIMGKRSARPTGWIVAGLLLALAAGAAYQAYQTGWIPAGWLSRGAKDGAPGLTFEKPVAPAAAGQLLETTLIKSGPESGQNPGPESGSGLAPVQTISVPLISVAPPSAAAGVAGAAPAAPAASLPAPAGASAAPGANALVLTLVHDSWVEIRGPGAPPLIARVLKAGSSETVEVVPPATLTVGKPGAVSATWRGAPLVLTPARRGAAARLKLE